MTHIKTIRKVVFLMEDTSLTVYIRAGSTSLSNHFVVWVFHFFIISIYLFIYLFVVVLLGKGLTLYGDQDNGQV